MNWFKRAMYETENYLSELEQEYMNTKDALERLHNAYKSMPNPSVKHQLSVMHARMKELRLALQMLNRKTDTERMERFKS